LDLAFQTFQMCLYNTISSYPRGLEVCIFVAAMVWKYPPNSWVGNSYVDGIWR
jgi:hypothetical protein